MALRDGAGAEMPVSSDNDPIARQTATDLGETSY
jgi:hypothetical protein